MPTPSLQKVSLNSNTNANRYWAVREKTSITDFIPPNGNEEFYYLSLKSGIYDSWEWYQSGSLEVRRALRKVKKLNRDAERVQVDLKGVKKKLKSLNKHRESLSKKLEKIEDDKIKQDYEREIYNLERDIAQAELKEENLVHKFDTVVSEAELEYENAMEEYLLALRNSRQLQQLISNGIIVACDSLEEAEKVKGIAGPTLPTRDRPRVRTPFNPHQFRLLAMKAAEELEIRKQRAKGLGGTDHYEFGEIPDETVATRVKQLEDIIEGKN